MKIKPQFLINPAARLLGVAVVLAVAAGCSKKEEVVAPTVSNEALTTVTLRLTNTADASNVVTAQWEQLLDNQGNPRPVDVSQANLTLRAGATYTGQLGLLDKSQSPTFDVGTEISGSRANYHSVFYQPLPTTGPFVIPAATGVGDDVYPDPIPTPLPAGPALNLTVTRTDNDTNKTPLPLGFQTRFVAGAASTGYLRVVLRHQPNVKDGTFAPGSTDLDAGFNVTIR